MSALKDIIMSNTEENRYRDIFDEARIELTRLLYERDEWKKDAENLATAGEAALREAAEQDLETALEEHKKVVSALCNA